MRPKGEKKTRIKDDLKKKKKKRNDREMTGTVRRMTQEEIKATMHWGVAAEHSHNGRL